VAQTQLRGSTGFHIHNFAERRQHRLLPLNELGHVKRTWTPGASWRPRESAEPNEASRGPAGQYRRTPRTRIGKDCRNSIIPTVADSRMEAAVSVCPAIRRAADGAPGAGWRSGGRFCFVLCRVTRLLARPHIFRRRCRLRYVFRRRSLLWTACRNSFGKLAHRLQLHSAIGYSQPRSPCSSLLEQPEHEAIIDRWLGRPARPALVSPAAQTFTT
jgi:hypothetical protein